jgi:hydrogenase 3 maturation protease
MRGDDGVGPKLIELLESMSLDHVLLLNTESVPEAFTGKVEAFNPTHVLILDAANFHGAPGEARLISGDEIGGQVVSTHSLPLNIFISYIEKNVGASVLLLGIQPITINFGGEMSPQVEATAYSVADILYQILSR